MDWVKLCFTYKSISHIGYIGFKENTCCIWDEDSNTFVESVIEFRNLHIPEGCTRNGQQVSNIIIYYGNVYIGLYSQLKPITTISTTTNNNLSLNNNVHETCSSEKEELLKELHRNVITTQERNSSECTFLTIANGCFTNKPIKRLNSNKKLDEDDDDLENVVNQFRNLSIKKKKIAFMKIASLIKNFE